MADSRHDISRVRDRMWNEEVVLLHKILVILVSSTWLGLLYPQFPFLPILFILIATHLCITQYNNHSIAHQAIKGMVLVLSVSVLILYQIGWVHPYKNATVCMPPTIS